MTFVRRFELKTARSTHQSQASHSSQTTAPAAPSSIFNARGVVVEPAFTLNRSVEGKSDIEFAVHSNPIGSGWAAEPMWSCRDGSLPVDATPLHEKSQVHLTLSEAVDAAMGRGLRQVRAQPHRGSDKPEWEIAVDQLAEWMAEAMISLRAADETLPMHGITVADLFAGGLGGFGVALGGLGASIDFACEIDADARAVYERNVRPKAMHADICTLDATNIKVDIATMGLICKAISKAGKGLGFADPKLANVYKHSLRVLSEIDAKVIVIECSRQLLTNHDGRDARELIDVLMQAGYRVQHRALNAANFGLPQGRERSFIVATRCGLDVDHVLGFLFPKESEPTAVVADIMDAGVIASIPASDITLHRAGKPRRSAKLAQVGTIAGRSCQGYRVYSPKSLGPALTASGGGRARFTGAYAIDGGARTLTPREAMRMQGLPEWAAHHKVHLHAMRHAGNAVAVPVARELGRQLATILSPRS